MKNVPRSYAPLLRKPPENILHRSEGINQERGKHEIQQAGKGNPQADKRADVPGIQLYSRPRVWLAWTETGGQRVPPKKMQLVDLLTCLDILRGDELLARVRI